MPRFLHTADWQIGRQFSHLAPEDGLALAEARLEVVVRIAELAAVQSVAAVLVAGDVFDAQTVSERTLRRLFNALAGYAGPWVLLPGNHDAALAESVWTRARRLGVVPPNVHLALTPEPILLADAGLAVLPAPLTQRHVHDDPTAWFDLADTDPGLIRVGLAHGSVEGLLAEGIDSPNPIAADRARKARLDYLALGDWHGTRKIDERSWYSGTPEPDGFVDNHPGNLLQVDIEAPGAPPQVTAVPVARYCWWKRQLNLAVSTDVEELARWLAERPDEAVVELELGGQLGLEDRSRMMEILAAAEARYRSLRVDDSALRLTPSEEDLAGLQADGYVQRVLTELQQAQDGEAGEEESGAVAREALVILAELLTRKESAS